MTVQQFEPKFMKISVLTAALQELTPREVRDKDPDRAIEEWLQFAHDVGADNIELSAALLQLCEPVITYCGTDVNSASTTAYLSWK